MARIIDRFSHPLNKSISEVEFMITYLPALHKYIGQHNLHSRLLGGERTLTEEEFAKLKPTEIETLRAHLRIAIEQKTKEFEARIIQEIKTNFPLELQICQETPPVNGNPPTRAQVLQSRQIVVCNIIETERLLRSLDPGYLRPTGTPAQINAGHRTLQNNLPPQLAAERIILCVHLRDEGLRHHSKS